MAENIQKNLVKAGFDDLEVQERPGSRRAQAD